MGKPRKIEYQFVLRISIIAENVFTTDAYSMTISASNIKEALHAMFDELTFKYRRCVIEVEVLRWNYMFFDYESAVVTSFRHINII